MGQKLSLLNDNKSHKHKFKNKTAKMRFSVLCLICFLVSASAFPTFGSNNIEPRDRQTLIESEDGKQFANGAEHESMSIINGLIESNVDVEDPVAIVDRASYCCWYSNGHCNDWCYIESYIESNVDAEDPVAIVN